MLRIAEFTAAVALIFALPAHARDSQSADLDEAAAAAQRQLKQSFTNLSFEDFQKAPIEGPVYQALAGGRIIYFVPQSEQLIFGAVYDKNGVNLTALAQDAGARKRIAALDRSDALIIGPAGAPQVIEFTDPDCPYSQAIERFWQSKAAEGKPVQRLVYFVSGIHPDAPALAEHILCQPGKEAAFKAIYAGQRPPALTKCKAGADKVARDAGTVRAMGVSGTPTVIMGGKLISGFQQAELDALLTEQAGSAQQSP